MPRIRPEGGLSGTYQTPTPYAASGMWTMRDLDRNRRIGSWPADVGASDEVYKYTGLLTHFDGTANDNNNNIKDSLTNTEFTKIPFADTFSVYFPGSIGYRTPLSNNFVLTSDFTMEMYVYFSGSPTDVALFNNYGGNNLSTNFALEITASNKVALFINGLSTVRITGTTTVTTGVWYHIAVVRSSGVVKLYVNGIQEGSSYSFSGEVGANTEEYYIAQYNAASRLTGYLSNFRVTNTAVYTTTFTPPTTTLTAISGTQLLIANSSTFVDNSVNAYTLTISQTGNEVITINPISFTRTGNPGQGTFSPYSQPAGNWSTYLDGASILSIAANANFLIGTQNFTIECWVYINSTGTIQGLVTSHQTGGMFQFYVTASRNIFAAVNTDGGTTTNYTNLTSASTISNGVWNHLALVRNGTEVAIYINGVKDTNTATLSAGANIGSYGGNKAIYIGSAADQNNKTTGHFSNVRYVVGSAVYTSNFTPPGPLTAISGTQLLTCQDYRFKDNSVNGFTVSIVSAPSISPFSPFAPTEEYSVSAKGGSYTLNGGEYFRISTAQTAFGLSTGNWTIELWAYFTIPNGMIWDTRTSGGGGSQVKPTLYFSSANNLSFYVSGATRISASGITSGQWYHIAIVKSSNSTRLYINGVQTGSAYTDTNDYGASAQLAIGASNDSVGLITLSGGYITDFRITKSAVYTSSFTPPTSPLTDNSCSLLLNGTNAKIINQTGSTNISTISGAKLSTTQSKFGGSSLVLNGTTDYLTLTYLNNIAANPSAIALGISNFTIEGWFYTNGSASIQTLFQINGNSAGYAAARLDITTSNTLQLLVSATGSAHAINYTTPSAPIVNLTWHHIALVRSGSNFYIFVDGVQRGVTQTSSLALMAGSGYNLIGAVIATSLQGYFNGYIDEFRITRYARYTSNFTPSSIPFSNR